MSHEIRSHQARPADEELQELLEIAQREHGPEATSTRRIRDALAEHQRSGETRQPARGDKPSAR